MEAFTSVSLPCILISGFYPLDTNVTRSYVWDAELIGTVVEGTNNTSRVSFPTPKRHPLPE